MLAVQNRKRKRLQNKQNKDETGEDTNFDIIIPKEKVKKVKKIPASQKNASKKQKKKLEKLREKKEQKEERERILASLEAHAVPTDQLGMFHSTCGRKPTVSLVQEHAKHKAIIVSHKKKRKKNTRVEKILNPTASIVPLEEEVAEEKEEEEEDESSSSEEEEKEELTEQEGKGEIPEQGPTRQTPTPEKNQEGTTDSRPRRNSLAASTPRKPTNFVSVERDPEIEAARLQLPILGEEQVIVEKITENDVVVIVGATGSGKTTQVPQFLYEAGYGTAPDKAGIIGVTEPRRVAAITTCARVKRELNIDNIDYQIRYEGTVTPATKLKFMTDGVLLRELQTDFLLSKYCVLIIDEAHERSLNTDILIGMLSRVVPLRRSRGTPLKLVIMSATLRVSDFTANSTLFPVPPPVVDVGSRQHPVTLHHARVTRTDYVREAYVKVCKLHRSLPPGDVLVFLTGVQEINRLIHLLRKTFPETLAEGEKKKKEEVERDEEESVSKVDLSRYDPYENKDDTVTEATTSATPSGEESGSETDDEEIQPTPHDRSLPLLALPLYSALPPDQQQRVFNSHSDSHRLVVVATNVAETSLTIPGISYVVDSGRVKTKEYCSVTGMSRFTVVWVSHASAEQRAGRAGRTGPGHCYRLYSSAVMGNAMVEHTEPEICKKPIDGLVLQMKNLNIHRILNFPFPTPPSLNLITTAERELLFLELLEPGKTVAAGAQSVNRITELGRRCVNLPVAPRFAKLLLLAAERSVLPFALTLVAALSVGHIFTGPIPAPFKPPPGPPRLLGDFMVLLSAVGAWEHAGGGVEWSVKHHLRHRALVEVRQLRRQLANIMGTALDPLQKPSSVGEVLALRQILTVCLGDHIGKLEDRGAEDGYASEAMEERVAVHKESVLHGSHADYLAFCSLEEVGGGVRMRGVLVVEEPWLATLLPSKCQFGDPLDQPPAEYSSDTGEVMCTRGCTFGTRGWLLPPARVAYPRGMQRFREFAAAILEGKVVKGVVDDCQTILLARPAVLRKTWATLQPRAEALLKQLVKKDTDTREKLLKEWKSDPTFLLSAICQWLPESMHTKVKSSWPPKDCF